MTTTEAIAATIAAHTPIGTRYQLVAVPGTELTVACANCGGAHHVQACGELRAALGRFDADSTIAWLREELDEARNHIGALVAAIDELDSLGEWVWSEADNAAIFSIYLHALHHAELTDRMRDARTWLRREAK